MSRQQRKPSGKGQAAKEIPISGLITSLVVSLLMIRYLMPTEATADGHTLWIVQGWMAAAFLWAAYCVITREFAISWNRYDGAIWVLVFAHVVAAIMVIVTEGQKRSAINMLWEWISLGVSYFLIRQVIRSPLDRQRLLRSFVVIATTLAGLGLWQHYIWYPSASAEYQKLRTELNELSQGVSHGLSPTEVSQRIDEIRIEFERQGVPSDPESLALWEQRLQSSSEPFGLFALANTFAGVLIVALIILIDFAWQCRQHGANWLIWTACAVVVAFCLVLTKSRTAWVGLFVGLTYWMWQVFSQIRNREIESQPKSKIVWIVGGVGVFALVVGIAGLSRGFDTAVLSEAPKSLKYRIQYWTGAMSIVKERPVFGAGPGNFRPHYLKHKLPESSEEIAAPHNFVLDVWSNAGTIGLCGLAIFLFALIHVSFRGDSFHSMNTEESDESRFVRYGMYASFAIFIFGDLALGSPLDFRVVTLMIASIGLSMWLSRISSLREDGESSALNKAVFTAAAIALLVHLLGADGIAMPAICQTLFVLFALLASNTDHTETRTQPSQKSPIITSSFLLISIVASVCCLLTASLPVAKRTILVNLGDAAYSEERNFRRAIRNYELAAAADPFSPTPLERLAELTFRSANSKPAASAAEFDQATEFAQMAIQLNPHSAHGYRRLANWHFRQFQRFEDRNSADSAMTAFEQAIGRYPNNARLVAEYSMALAEIGDQRSKQAAKRALQLDQINRSAGHRDRYLPDEIRSELVTISEEKSQKLQSK